MEFLSYYFSIALTILSKQTSLISWFHFRRSYFGLDEGWVLIADAMMRFESFSKSDFGTASETSAIQKINSPHETEKVSEPFFEGQYSSARCQYCVGSAFV